MARRFSETGRLVRQARQQMGMTLQRFSERIPGKSGHGVDPVYLHRVELGRESISVKQAEVFERASGLPAGELVVAVVKDAAPGAPLTHAILRRFLETAPRDRLEELRARVEAQLSGGELKSGSGS